MWSASDPGWCWPLCALHPVRVLQVSYAEPSWLLFYWESHGIYFDLDGLLGAIGNFVQGHLDLDADIAAPLPLPAVHHDLFHRRQKKESKNGITKNVAELAEDIIHIHTSARTAKTTGTTHACMAELIVPLFLFRIAQYVIGFWPPLELFFGFFITGSCQDGTAMPSCGKLS